MTMMVCVKVEALPQSSVAVHVRKMVYEVPHDPSWISSEGSEMETLPQSLASTVAIGISSLHDNSMFAGVEVNSGPSVSTIVKY